MSGGWVPPAASPAKQAFATALALGCVAVCVTWVLSAAEILTAAGGRSPLVALRSTAGVATAFLAALPLPRPRPAAPLVSGVSAEDERLASESRWTSNIPGVGLAAAPWTDEALQARIAAVVPPRGGRVAVAVRHLPSGASARLNAHAPMPPASVFKLGLMVETFARAGAGGPTLTDSLLITPDDWMDGAGVLQAYIGTRVSTAEALRLMIGQSDNTAAALLLRHLGDDAVNAAYRRNGLHETAVFGGAWQDATTAADTAALLELLATGQLGDVSVTARMLELLSQDQPAAFIRAALPPDVLVAHKSGQLPGIRNDAAVVYSSSGPYVLVVFTDGLWDDAAGERYVAAIATQVHAHIAEAFPPAESAPE